MGLLVLAGLAIPAFIGNRPSGLPAASRGERAVRESPRSPSGDDLPAAPSADGMREIASAPPTRTRATVAWELAQGPNAEEAAIKIRELLRAESDDRVRCEIIGAASTVDATPTLHRLFEESAGASQSSRVRQVALDLWLTVYPDEASTIARKFLTDPDEEVRGVAEDYFEAKREEPKQR